MWHVLIKHDEKCHIELELPAISAVPPPHAAGALFVYFFASECAEGDL